MRRVRIGDIMIGILSLAVILLIGIESWSGSGGSPELHIQVDEDNFVYSLATDQHLEISGPIGTTYVTIEDGHVHVDDSPCTQKICVAAGEISRTGEWIICLPNHVFITIEGVEETSKEVDDVVF